MDERKLRKLAAAAEHERWVADRADEAVASVAGKLAKAEALVAAARDEQAEAKRVAKDAEQRARAAETAYRESADGASVTATAGTAAAKVKAS